MEKFDRTDFVEKMLNERYETDEEVTLRKCHLWDAMCSFNFRNDKGLYYWHNNNNRNSKQKKINII